MRFDRLDLNLLVALNHLMTLKSVSSAARKMNLSQSAMSNALSRLRDYFDDPLLVPVGRSMELSPKARAMQFAVLDILVRIEATVSSDQSFDPASAQREFRILLSDYTMAVLMPAVLALAYARAPDARFRLLPQVEQPSLAIERGEADLLIAPSIMASPLHPMEPLFEDEFVCIACARGRFGRTPVGREAYLSARHVRMIPPSSRHTFDEDALSKAGLTRQVDIHCYSFAALPFLLQDTDRLATLQRSLAETFKHAVDIAIHPLPVPFPRMVQSVQWHVHRDSDLGLRWVRGLLREAAGLRVGNTGLLRA